MASRASFGASRRCSSRSGVRRRSSAILESPVTARPCASSRVSAERRAARGYPCPPAPMRSTSISDSTRRSVGRSLTSRWSATTPYAATPAGASPEPTSPTAAAASRSRSRPCCRRRRPIWISGLDHTAPPFPCARSSSGGSPALKGDGVTLSVLVTTFGRREYLERCVRSILGQERPPDELVLVTRKHDADSEAFVRQLIDSYPGPVRVRHATVEQPGVLAANIAGFSLVTGEGGSFRGE